MKHDDMAIIRNAIQDIAGDYSLNPKAAQELLRKILAILQAYQDAQDQE